MKLDPMTNAFTLLQEEADDSDEADKNGKAKIQSKCEEE